MSDALGASPEDVANLKNKLDREAERKKRKQQQAERSRSFNKGRIIVYKKSEK